MTTRTELADLLGVAHDTLAHSVVPSLAGGVRYDGLMVLNALGIARRTLISDERKRIELASQLFRLLGGTHPSDGDARHTLAREIRSGRFDHPSIERPEALLKYLKASIELRLCSENPKALETGRSEVR